MSEVKFTIYGEVVGKGRPRFSTVGGFAKAYTPKKTTNYEALVKSSYLDKYQPYLLEKGALRMEIDIYMLIPKSASKKAAERMSKGIERPTKKPDIDNIIKSIADALNGLAYHDDSQIVSVSVNKYWGYVPRAEVKIKEV